jgi:hypothetical protein
MIAECANNFGAAPRSISLWYSLTYWRVVRPEWLYQTPNDELETIFLNLSKLKRKGQVVWGHIIQANSLLFSPGQWDCPAEVVYSLHDPDISLEELSEIAGELYALKSTEPAEPERRVIADYLTNEMVRVYGLPVPASISPKLRCQISTTYVVRKHLPKPDRCLRQHFLPMIVHPTPPHIALPLPSRYWPKALVEWWTH